MNNLEQNLIKLGLTTTSTGSATPELTNKLHEGLKKLLIEVGLEAFEVQSLKIAPQQTISKDGDLKPLDAHLCFCCTGNIWDFDCRWDPDCNCDN